MNPDAVQSGALLSLVLIILAIPLALLPAILAVRKKHPHKVAIILVNILGGLLYGLGWFIALVWCFIIPSGNRSSSNNAAEIEKLYELKQKGVITEKEFDLRKNKLLST
ncbi:MAG: hypothetical protein DIZ78_17700 [endosymbiont of Escarpia spicata]|uniref:SHOCT domain-containing protein n=1 Tax=endosymbiont of Escarpia spicata TaxID=2200908 RepID=A0A370D7U0_9GAMM|nr:MAG: hypothetical protein DIZ78_17700 [endosymbiont of Escarpia spicata]